MIQPTLSKEDKLWRARDDANTLARAEEIMMDRTRRSMASVEAAKMVEAAKKTASALSKVATKAKPKPVKVATKAKPKPVKGGTKKK